MIVICLLDIFFLDTLKYNLFQNNVKLWVPTLYRNI
jgi:hypothetical protein